MDQNKIIKDIPRIGLGVYENTDKSCIDTCINAFDIGYKLIDTASSYNNEKEVGYSLKISAIKREDYFIVTKVKRSHAVSYNAVIDSCKRSLDKLNLDYLDLLLIHAPPWNFNSRIDSWLGMEECLNSGLTRYIGVSNYGAHHLDMMYSYTKTLPSFNQIEVHPWLQRIGLTSATQAVEQKLCVIHHWLEESN